MVERTDPGVFHYYDPNIVLLSEKSAVTCNDTGWVTALSAGCAHRGAWYYEAIITLNQPTSDTSINGYQSDARVGWAARYQSYQTPIGAGPYSFGYSPVTDTYINGSLTTKLHSDVVSAASKFCVGCYLFIPETKWSGYTVQSEARMHSYYQAGILCDPAQPPKCITIPNSFIGLTVDGESWYKIFVEIPIADYHPACSLFQNATVTFKSSPPFAYVLPRTWPLWRPIGFIDMPS